MSDTATPAAAQPTLASATVVWTDPSRKAAFDRWLAGIGRQHGLLGGTLRVVSADAINCRYLRMACPNGSRIILDAAPEKQDCRAFVRIAALMATAGLQVPQVLAWDETSGFLLLSDLGDQTLMQAVDPHHPQASLPLYQMAIDALIQWQLASRPGELAPCDETLLSRELTLFPQWYLEQFRGVVPDADMQRTLQSTFALIIRENLSWPSVYVHRDFVPRNLTVPSPGDPRLGVLGFQNAVCGPITCDIASLLRDAFLSWDEEFVLDVTIRYWEKARAAGLPAGADFGAFYRGVEWIGLQRHLKLAGSFARLTLRDGKPQYLPDTPRLIAYIRATAARYRELRPLLRLVDKIEGIQDQSGFAFGRV